MVLPPVLCNLGGSVRTLILRKTRTSNRMLNANTQNEETAKASVWVGGSSSGAPGEGYEETEGHRRTAPRPQALPAACDTAQKHGAPGRVYEQNLEGNHPPQGTLLPTPVPRASGSPCPESQWGSRRPRLTARVQTGLTNEEDLTRFILSQPHKMRHLSKT